MLNRKEPMSQPFILGVNYWPRRKAMYWWSDFDADEVRDEFGLIRDLGLQLVRIFLLWDDFQPEPDRVSSKCLDALVKVADIATDLGLQLDVTFFTGHMSGPNWSPRWLISGQPAPGSRVLVSQGRVVNRGYRNPFTDPEALQAERLQVETIVRVLHDHPGIGVWNLGNEPDIFAQPPNSEIGQRWVYDLVQLIHNNDSAHPVTCGLHSASLLMDNGLRIDRVFAETDFGVMHIYPMYLSPWLARSPLDTDLVPFSCALTAALGGKPVLMEEFGGCTAPPGRASFEMQWRDAGKAHTQFMAAEQDLAEYLQEVLPKLVQVGATGALVWCFADYARELWDRPPCDSAQHERFFGLVRPDGSLKPHAEVLRQFAATKPTVQTSAQTVTIPYSADEYYRDPRAHIIKLYRQWTGDR
jgi:endo-1,4-beta-mannosidase